MKEFVSRNIKTEVEIQEERKIKASGGKGDSDGKAGKLKEQERGAQDWSVVIEDDFTWKEREMQRKLREMARQKREEGKRVMVKYKEMMICIEQKWYVEETVWRKGKEKEMNEKDTA